IEREDDPLSAPLDRLDLAPGDVPRKIEFRGRDDVAAQVGDALDPPAEQARRQRRYNGLHFRQFRHRWRPVISETFAPLARPWFGSRGRTRVTLYGARAPPREAVLLQQEIVHIKPPELRLVQPQTTDLAP